MVRKSDLIERLSELADATSGDSSKAIAQIVKPDASLGQDNLVEQAKTLRGGRAELESLFRDKLVADRLAAILGDTEVNREQIHVLLNTPFPHRQEITVAFLDLLVARVQQLERFVGLLSATLVEMQYPSDRSPVNYHSATSATRRHV